MTGRRRFALAGFLACLLAILLITLTPTPVDAGRADWVEAVLTLLHGMGVPDSFGYTQLEFTANIAMFIPLGAFLAALLPPHRRPIAFLALPQLSAASELIQLFALPERHGTLADVLANSIGAWLGLAAVMVATRPRSRER